MANILVVDDDPIFASQMGLYLTRLGHEHRCADSLARGVDLAAAEPVDLVFLDIHLPDASGLTHIGRFREAPGSPEVVIITARSDPDSAEQAIMAGAWYYLEKPPAFNAIQLTLERALEFRRRKAASEACQVLERDAIVGRSPALKRSLAELARAARGWGNVLVTGETGTGKELFARALHDNSPRRGGPFVVADCTNIPESLAESLLFGHVKGSFTHAVSDREGMFALAHGGTLLLDEVGDMPESLQRSLLRVLQEKRFRPLGADRERSSDFRVVALTNRDLPGLAESGQFRPDLYYRLAQSVIALPPLREREGDVELLAAHVLSRLCVEHGVTARATSREFLDALNRHPWPGNVRELANAVSAALANAGDEPVLQPWHLPVELRAGLARSGVRPAPPTPAPPAAPAAPAAGGAFPTLHEYRETARESLEAAYLDLLVAAAGGDPGLAMALAGLSKARLYQLLKKHGRSLRRSGESQGAS